LGLERLTVLPNLLNLLFLGLIASALCYVTWNFAINMLGPVKTSVYIYMIPVITIVASALVLHETITLVSGAGTALILIGMALSERNKPG
jgi:drug/metabolite transporter (DMT)-like permease